MHGFSIPMEVDTGASKSVISKSTLDRIGGKLETTDMKLRTYTGEEIKILGETTVDISHEDENRNFSAIVVEGDGPNLMGRDWLTEIRLNWHEIFTHSGESDLLKDYESIFDGQIGTYTGAKEKIVLKENAQPKYFKARPVPYALKDKIGLELDRLEREGIIQKVQYSDWAAPIVPIVKDDGSIRICGDYKVTINPVSCLDNYPIPKTEDLFANIKGKFFFKT